MIHIRNHKMAFMRPNDDDGETMTMNAIELTARKHLSQDTQSSAAPCIELQSFCKSINESSLNMKVHEALTFRRQGHFNKAMLNITEANRDQMIAIRKVQSLLGHVRSERYPEVVLEKFRQFEPFEMGLSDANAVLSILADLDDKNDLKLQENRLKLHDYELQKKDKEDYLLFLERRSNEASTSEDVVKTKANLASLAQKLTELRAWFLEKILVVLGRALNGMPSGGEKDRLFLELSQNAFLIITSPILTKPASQVETEM